MLDKTIILVIIAFIFVGILSYQKVLTDKGEIPLLAKLIDRGGLAKMDEDATLQKSERNYSYQFGTQENLDRLDQKFTALKEQQSQMLENRYDHLEALTAQTGDIQAQANAFAVILKEEEQTFYDQMDRMKELRRDIDALPAPGPAREALIERINAQLQAVFDAATEDSGAPMPEFAAILERTQTIVDGLDADCPDIEACLREHLAVSEGALEELGQERLNVPAGDLTRLTELAAANTQQFKFLRNNVEATQGTLDENSGRIQENLADITLLTQMSEADFREAAAILESIMEEQQIYLYNLALHQQQFEEEQQENSRRMNAIVARLKEAPDKDFGKITQSCEVFDADREAWLRELKANMPELASLTPRPQPVTQPAASAVRPTVVQAQPSAGSHTEVLPRQQFDQQEQAVAAASAQADARMEALRKDPPSFYNADEHMERARQQNRENQRRLNQLLENYRR